MLWLAAPSARRRPCKKTWCSGDRRKHLLLCVTSEKHFGNCYTHICSRPEIWLMKMGDPWARHGANDQIVGLEPELVPPPKRVLVRPFPLEQPIWNRSGPELAFCGSLSASEPSGACLPSRALPPAGDGLRWSDGGREAVGGCRSPRARRCGSKGAGGVKKSQLSAVVPVAPRGRRDGVLVVRGGRHPAPPPPPRQLGNWAKKWLDQRRRLNHPPSDSTECSGVLRVVKSPRNVASCCTTSCRGESSSRVMGIPSDGSPRGCSALVWIGRGSE